MTINNSKWAGLDPSKREAFERAAGPLNEPSVLVDNVVNRVVQQLSSYYQGAVSTMDRRPGQGAKSIQVDRTGLSGIGSGAGNAANWVGTADPTDTVGTYAQTEWAYRTLATRGSVTRLSLAQGRSYIDVMAEEMGAKLDDMNEALETAIFRSVTSATAIDGLMNYMGNNATRNGQLIKSDESQADAVAFNHALTLASLDKAIDMVKGSSMRSDLVIYCSQAGSRQLNKLLQTDQQFTDVTEIAAGFRVRTYDGIPIVITTGIPDDTTFDSNIGATRFTAITGGDTTSICIVNKRYVWLEELTPMTVLPLAKSTSAQDSFDMYWDGVLVVSNWKGVAFVAGVNPSA
jgi:hypothetical protein